MPDGAARGEVRELDVLGSLGVLEVEGPEGEGEEGQQSREGPGEGVGRGDEEVGTEQKGCEEQGGEEGVDDVEGQDLQDRCDVGGGGDCREGDEGTGEGGDGGGGAVGLGLLHGRGEEEEVVAGNGEDDQGDESEVPDPHQAEGDLGGEALVHRALDRFEVRRRRRRRWGSSSCDGHRLQANLVCAEKVAVDPKLG